MKKTAEERLWEWLDKYEDHQIIVGSDDEEVVVTRSARQIYEYVLRNFKPKV